MRARAEQPSACQVYVYNAPRGRKFVSAFECMVFFWVWGVIWTNTVQYSGGGGGWQQMCVGGCGWMGWHAWRRLSTLRRCAVDVRVVIWTGQG